MTAKVVVTVAALERMTPPQLQRLQQMLQPTDSEQDGWGKNIIWDRDGFAANPEPEVSRQSIQDDTLRVFVAFELPQTYVAFTLRGIYGGIDAEGEVST